MHSIFIFFFFFCPVLGFQAEVTGWHNWHFDEIGIGCGRRSQGRVKNKFKKKNKPDSCFSAEITVSCLFIGINHDSV